MQLVPFGSHLKVWRQQRKLSQLDLALQAEVSQRHVSWLETGRSQPSRSMVIRLAEALEIPLRERNPLLGSAGFAPIYRESELDAEHMAPVESALMQILDHHMPMPALVVNRWWQLKMTNDAADQLLAVLGGEQLWQRVDPSGNRSLALLTLHPKGLRPLISNWREAAPAFIQRVRQDALAAGNPQAQADLEQLLNLVGGLPEAPAVQPLLPMLPLELSLGSTKLSLFSVISTFGTPQDITVDELRIESFFPTDEVTRQFFEQMSTA